MKKIALIQTLFIYSFLLFSQENKTKPFALVSNQKMNVFYMGIENPVHIVVAEYKCDSIYAKTNNGSLDGSGCRYKVFPDRIGEANISVYAISGNDTILLGPYKFRVKSIPDPVAKLSGKNGGKINKNLLIQQKGIYAELENFDFDAKFKILSFKIKVIRDTIELKTINNEGTLFNNESMALFNQLQSGDKLIVYDIIAKGPDGIERELELIDFFIPH